MNKISISKTKNEERNVSNLDFHLHDLKLKPNELPEGNKFQEENLFRIKKQIHQLKKMNH